MDFIAQAIERLNTAWSKTKNEEARGLLSGLLNSMGFDQVDGEWVKPNLRNDDQEDRVEFQQEVAEMLVLAWRDSGSAEAKTVIEEVMRALGVIPEGLPGIQFRFTGLCMKA